MSGQTAGPVTTTAARQLYADPAAAAAQSVDKIAAARVWLLDYLDGGAALGGA